MLTTSWFEGYVGLEDYITHYYENLSPFHLQWQAAMCGFQTPRSDQPFNYIDICSGRGVSLVLHAANFPHAKFYGVDLSSSHIAQSRELARRAGVNNVEFFEAPVGEMQQLGLPEMDFMVIQGAYSWLSKKNQLAVRKFVESHLKPGGIFQVHYISYPGALRSEAILRMIYDYSHHETGNPSERLGKAIEKLKKFTTINMGAFSDPEGLKKQLEQRFNQDLRYLAHDLLSKDRRGHFFTEMSDEMRDVRLEYICSNVPYRNLPLETYGKSAAALRNFLPEQDHVEMLKDYFMGEAVRRDIFQRGRMSVPANVLIDDLRKMSFIRMSNVDTIKTEVKTQAFSMNMPQRQTDVMKSVMERRKFSGKDIIDAFTKAAIADNLAPNAYLNGLGTTLLLFYMVGHLKPLLPEPQAKASRKSCASLNEMVMKLPITDNSVGALVSPVLGAGMTVNPVERMVMRALIEQGGETTNLREKVVMEARKIGVKITFNKTADGDMGSMDAMDVMDVMTEVTAADMTPAAPAAPAAATEPKDQDEALGQLVDDFIKNRLALYRELEILAKV